MTLKWRARVAWAAGLVIGLPLLLLAVALGVLNTAPGQRAAERLTSRFTRGTVVLAGLHGTIPQAPRLDRLTLRDGSGVWLTVDQIALDWSPWRLLGGTAAVQSLSVQHAAVLRLPQSAPAARAPAPSPMRLPVSIDVSRIDIADLALADPVLGAVARFSVLGSMHARSLTRGAADLMLRRTDAAGSYDLHVTGGATSIAAQLHAQEAAGGVLARLAGVPDLGAIGLDASLTGPLHAAALHLALAAGALRAHAGGTLDLPGQAADLTVQADAPAMRPAPDLSWRAVSLSARLTGPWLRPTASGTLGIEGLAADGASVARIDGRIAADTHAATLTAEFAPIQLPPPNQALLAGGPLSLHARLQLDDPARPISFGFEQAVLRGAGNAVLAPALRGRLEVTVPALEPIARSRARDVTGHAALTVQVAREHPAATRIDVDAALEVTGGADAPPAARGITRLGATATLDGADIDLSRLQLDGSTVHVSGTGARRSGQLVADAQLHTTDLHSLVPSLRGALDVALHLAGPQRDFALTGTLSGTLGTAALAPAALTASVRAAHLPDRPAGHLDAQAELAGAPLALNLDATRAPDQTLHLTINRAEWKSARISGALSLPAGTTVPTGTLALAMTRLDDLRPLLGQPASGALTATLDLPAGGAARLHVQASNAGVPGRASVTHAVLNATVGDPATRPVVDGTLTAAGVHVGNLQGGLRLVARGPLQALALQLDTSVRQSSGAAAAIQAAGTLGISAHTLQLTHLRAAWKGEELSLAAPATLRYAPDLAIDHLRLTASTAGAAAATLDLAGTLSPVLALTASVRGLTPALARPFVADFDADGVLRADARLGGTRAEPTGTLHVAATGLRVRRGTGGNLPAADIQLDATLAGGSAQIAARLHAGSAAALTVRGIAPLAAGGTLALRAEGTASLAVLDPLLTPQGRRVRGTATLAATIGGTLAAPALAGTLGLSHGEVQDYANGIHLTDLTADLVADGQTLRLTRLSARAGGGTIAATGTLGLAAPRSVDLRITADNARPIVSDLLTATLDGTLALTGTLQSGMAAAGRIHVRRADIQVPDRLPATVAVLDVRRPGQAARAPAAPGPPIPLDIVLDAPRQVFVRGRGLDAELGGTLHIGGTAAAPQTSGSIDLRRGQYTVVGQTLTFTSGTIGFNGAARIDPALDLVATSSTPSLTATLTVGGYASAPKITLSSVPDRPQDEILAALLFGQSATSLSPFQLAEIGAALAQLSGVGGGADPLDRLRRGLGLDRLSVGSAGAANPAGGSSAGTAVEAGRYLARGVYVGAKQGTAGAQTQAEVQIDLTRGLKLSTDVGSGAGGNTVGLTYQFQY